MQISFAELPKQIRAGNFRLLARAISMVENQVGGYLGLLESLTYTLPVTPVIGITGPPGAGKSTLVNAVLSSLDNRKIAILAVDPSSPFNLGALLGDRIRMAQHYNNPNIFIRSVANRGSLGGLSNSIIEIVDVLKAANFDYIFVETVGVGQSEVEIAGLADSTVVVLVPEAGDEIQTMKSGLMEIADIFVVNKADRANAHAFYVNLKKLVHGRPYQEWEIPVLKTTATQQKGIDELLNSIHAHQKANLQNDRRALLITQKAIKLLQQYLMRHIDQQKLYLSIQQNLQKENFNLYTFLNEHYFQKQ